MAKSPAKQAEEALESIKKSRIEASTSKVAIKRLEKTSESAVAKLNVLINKLKSDLNTEKTETSEIRKAAKSEYNRFSTTYRTAMNARDGVEARHKKLTQLHTDAVNLENEISKNATKSRNSIAQISELQQEARKNGKDIKDVNTRANIVKQEIEDTYGIVVDTTLAGTLVERREQLSSRVNLWQRVYLISLALIAIAIVLALAISRPDSFSQVITERLVFITPLVIIAFVASRQFVHERSLLEEYAFKAATAQSLRGYTLLLNEQFKDLPTSRIHILNFVVGAMNGIYDRKPLEAKTTNYHFIFGHKFARLEAKIEEIKEEIQKEKAAITELAESEAVSHSPEAR